MRKSRVAGVAVKAIALELSNLSATNGNITSSVEVGKSSIVSVTLTNSSAYTAKEIQLSTLSAPWSVSENNCATVAANSTCVIKLSYMPISVGPSTAEVKVTYNNGSTTFSLSGTSYALVTVDSIYPNNGANWNDYVINNNGGTNRYDQPDTACAGTENYYDGCIHGGEKRKVTLKYTTSCDGLSLAEELGVFNWVCKVVKGTAYYYSTGLKEEKRLADLIETTGTAFKSNSVKVYKSGALYYKSDAKKWWTNTVTTLPSNPNITDAGQVLTSVGTIYTLVSSADTSGYNINADKIAITTLGDSILSWSGTSTANTNTATGEVASPTGTVMIGAGSQNFLWLEGNFNGKYTVDYGVLYWTVHHSRLRIASFQNMGYGAISSVRMVSSKSHLIEKVSSVNGGTGMDLPGSTSSYHVVNDFKSTNDVIGLSIAATADNYYTRIQVNNAQIYGVLENTTANRNTMHLLSLIHNGTSINFRPNGSYDQISQYLSINSGTGLQSTAGGNQSFAQIAIFNSTTGISNTGGNNNYYTQNILMGGVTTACNISAPTNPGLVNTTCANQATSDATANISMPSIASTIIGKVTNDDSKNSLDTSGTVAFTTLTTGFSFFDNWFRGWGKDGSAFPNTDHKGTCATGTCRMWDMRYSASDTVLRGKSNDGVTAETFKSGQTCPQAVHGNKSWVGNNGKYNLFNAAEVMGDDLGNDNGMCESDEACIYQPNYGAYLGEGDYLNNGTCKFQDGNVTGVTMYAYPTNGG